MYVVAKRLSEEDESSSAECRLIIYPSDRNPLLRAGSEKATINQQLLRRQQVVVLLLATTTTELTRSIANCI
jgi:hypothetical protein